MLPSALAEAARGVVVGFDGTRADDAIRHALRELCVGGVILFSRNYESPEQLVELIAELRALSRHERLLVAVDQEGGPVQRFREPFTVWPEMAAVGESDDPALARRVGAAIATELAAVGIDLNFAPVADVNTNPDNPVIGRRAFGSDAARVAEMVAAFVEGHQGAGVPACAKHFPGHGDTRADSHTELPVLGHDLSRLASVELVPFRAAARAGVASIMTAHVLWPALDPDHPATLSERVLAPLLTELAYDGLVVSDDLEMAAVAGRYSMGEAACRAMTAGCDALLVCKSIERQEAVVRGLYDGGRSGLVPHERVRRASMKIDTLLDRVAARRPPMFVVGCAEHRALAASLGQTQ